MRHFVIALACASDAVIKMGNVFAQNPIEALRTFPLLSDLAKENWISDVLEENCVGDDVRDEHVVLLMDDAWSTAETSISILEITDPSSPKTWQVNLGNSL